MDIFGALKKNAGFSISVRIRLYAILFMFIVILTSAVVIILLVSGQITTGTKEAEEFAQKEFSAISQNMKSQYGNIAAQLTWLSQTLSQSVEYQLSQKEVHIRDIQKHPDMLEDILGIELNRLLLTLERTDCSGVFLVIDATVNPYLTNSENSKAGLYIRYSEPRIPGSPDRVWDLLRGFPNIAYQIGLVIPRIWEMEFDTENRAFFDKPMEQNIGSSQPLSKLHYWGMESIIPELDETILSCSIPLIGSDGNPFGICGLEISIWNFGVNHEPDDSEYRGIVCIFGEINDEGLQLGNVLYSGKHTAMSAFRDNSVISVFPGNELNTYVLEDGNVYLGLHEEIRLHSAGSPYTSPRYALSLMVPQAIIDEIAYQKKMRVVFIFAALLAVGVSFSLFFGKKYFHPILADSESLVLEAQKREQELIADNEILDRLNRMKIEFFQNMSHDFKTPLTVISTCVMDTSDMLDFEIDKTIMRENLDNVQNEIIRLARLVDSTMKYTSLHDNRQEMRPLDLAPLLREGSDTYRVLIERNGNMLVIDMPESLPHILGNADMLLHVLANLLTNANRHTLSGKISVEAYVDRDMVNVTVRDTGTGIKPELLPDVFGRGVSDSGTGLGLSICKTAIEAHHGTISIKSKYGHGTEVLISLPIYLEQNGKELGNEQ